MRGPPGWDGVTCVVCGCDISLVVSEIVSFTMRRNLSRGNEEKSALAASSGTSMVSTAYYSSCTASERQSQFTTVTAHPPKTHIRKKQSTPDQQFLTRTMIDR